MSCPRDSMGLLNPEFPILDSGEIPKDRQLFLVDKEELKDPIKAFDVAYDSNIPNRRYVLWRIQDDEEGKFALGTLLDHKRYWYFECVLVDPDKKYQMSRHGALGQEF